jgi:hypothetical protein
MRASPVHGLAQVPVLLPRRALPLGNCLRQNLLGRGSRTLLVPGRNRSPRIPAGYAPVTLIRIRHATELNTRYRAVAET